MKGEKDQEMKHGNKTVSAATAVQSWYGGVSPVGTWADIYGINGNLCK